MATTTRWELRYPTGGDAPDVPLWMHELATDLDGVAMDDQGLLGNRPTSTVASPGKRGRYWYATDNGRLYRDNGTGWDEVPIGSGQRVEVGDYKHSLQAANHGTRPDGLWAWLLADGSETPAGYTDLLALLNAASKPFGTGPGGRAKLPNLIGRVPLQPGAATGLTTRALGATVGEETHTLSVGEVPPLRISAPPQSAQGDSGFGFPRYPSGGSFGPTLGNLVTEGGGGSHNNLQPSLASGSWFVKT